MITKTFPVHSFSKFELGYCVKITLVSAFFVNIYAFRDSLKYGLNNNQQKGKLQYDMHLTFSKMIILVDKSGNNAHSYSGPWVRHNISLGGFPFSPVICWIYDSKREFSPGNEFLCISYKIQIRNSKIRLSLLYISSS